MKLENRTALVTGGSRGIGRAIATALAEEGAAVAVNYRSGRREAEEVVARIEKDGGRAVALAADVADPDAARDLAERAREELGGLDILVNNAGVADDALIFEMRDSAWREVMDVNFGGVFNCTRAVMDHFMRERGGVVVNISSGMGERGWVGQANYAASKAAINAFTRCSALELARFGVRVNALTPGFASTDMVEELLEQEGRRIRPQIPLGDFGTVEQIASVAVFLAGPGASYMTGQTVTVDGGTMAQLGFGRLLPVSRGKRG